MESRTARRGLPVPSASCRNQMRATLLLLLLVFSLAALSQAPPSDVKDCQPCTFQPGPTLPPYHFTFEVRVTRDGRTVEAIRVANANETDRFQRLAVKNMTPISDGQSFFFGGVDLNQDGFLDLMLVTDRGVANAYADYWLFEPRSGQYAYLGRYPVFRLDAQRRRLLTYERGGDAGLIFESREYEFCAGKLLLVKSEMQDATEQHGIFRKVTRKRVAGEMKIVRIEKVKAP